MRLLLLAFATVALPLVGCGDSEQPTVTTTPNEIQAFNEANPGVLIGDDDESESGP